MRTTLLLALCAGACFGQLNGIVDVHVHCDPDSSPRSIDALEAARQAIAEAAPNQSRKPA
jgi:hypothetical protein